ncbi:MAG TPA: hypothetical protein ENI63_00860 [Candidatus Kaiserbacteria bacterium]|nr:hypothetical protein [Candidatus Kaiserbacteria bacterium]
MEETNEVSKCEEFLNGIVHPNEQILAREIMEGKKLGEFSLSFDQAQIDTMTASLENVGCEFVKDGNDAVEETETPEVPETSETPVAPETPVDAVAQDTTVTPEAPVVPDEEPLNQVETPE